MVHPKTDPVKAVVSVGRISVGAAYVRDAPPTVSGGFISGNPSTLVKDPWEPRTVFPILVDGREIIALSRADACRFAQAMLNEVS